MLIERNELSQDRRGQRGRHDRGRGTVAGEDAGRNQFFCSAFSANLFCGLTESQSLGLSKEVRQEQLVHIRISVANRPRRLSEGNEVCGDHAGSLMNQLVEGVLTIRSGFTPEDLAGVVEDRASIAAHGFAIRLHGELLQVCGETVQVLRVREHCMGVRTQEV